MVVLDKVVFESWMEINVVSSVVDRFVMVNKLCCVGKLVYCSRGVKIML